MPWTVAAASVRGAAHAADGTPGQDAHAVATPGEWLVAVVCDGAGSALLSETGATVGAAAACGAFARACAAAPDGPPTEAYWRPAAHAAVAEARAAVARALAETPDGTDDRGLPCFERAHATLVCAVARPGGGLLVHIGDGTAIVTHGDAVRAVSAPENGVYANETFFFTEPDWDAHLRLTPVAPPFDNVVLLSDGGAALAMKDGALFEGFAGPVGRFLAGVSGREGSAALAETLADPRTDAVTGDDKTVIWARLAPRGAAPPGATTPGATTQ
ncbi:MAG TPA: protein phosphatase 2C domain-containing protein [Rubricoccaceae bacterium]